MKRLLFVFLMLNSIKAVGCSCGFTRLAEKYQRSEFIAIAKILKIEQNINDQDYHDVDIELKDLYKGKAIKKLKVLSVLNSSCAFLPSESTTWLIFASTDRKGFLSFGFCSGSKQIDRQFDLIEYPNLDVKYRKSIDLKLEVLAFIKKNKIPVGNNNLITNDYSICSDELKGFNENERFAVYQIDVNRDLSIENIQILKKFKNRKLSKTLTACIRNNLKIKTKNMSLLPEKTEITLIYFCYPGQGENTSVVSPGDL